MDMRNRKISPDYHEMADRPEIDGSPAMKRPVVTAVSPVDENHQVVTVTGGTGEYMRRPCVDCPWRRDAVGVFPPGAFMHSAKTAYDMAQETFACHRAGTQKPVICAGFILRGADHNLKIRVRKMRGQSFADVDDGGTDLFHDYVDMAIANGVDPDDVSLSPCRRNDFS